MLTNPQVKQKVYFGRPHGEKTLGEIAKVNRVKVKIKQLEERGEYKDHKVGTVWTVPLSLVWEAPKDAVPGGPQPKLEVAPRRSPLGQGSRVPAHVRGSRPESEVLADILGLYGDMSPENLTCDGELPLSQVRAKLGRIRRDLEGLFVELGRRVSETEAYAERLSPGSTSARA
jgi:hypothetical protein